MFGLAFNRSKIGVAGAVAPWIGLSTRAGNYASYDIKQNNTTCFRL